MGAELSSGMLVIDRGGWGQLDIPTATLGRV